MADLQTSRTFKFKSCSLTDKKNQVHNILPHEGTTETDTQNLPYEGMIDEETSQDYDVILSCCHYDNSRYFQSAPCSKGSELYFLFLDRCRKSCNDQIITVHQHRVRSYGRI